MSTSKQNKRIGGKGAGVFNTGRRNNAVATNTAPEKAMPAKIIEKKLVPEPVVQTPVKTTVEKVVARKPTRSIQQDKKVATAVERITILCDEGVTDALDFYLLEKKMKNKLKIKRSNFIKAFVTALLNSEPTLDGCNNYEDLVGYFENKLRK